MFMAIIDREPVGLEGEHVGVPPSGEVPDRVPARAQVDELDRATLLEGFQNGVCDGLAAAGLSVYGDPLPSGRKRPHSVTESTINRERDPSLVFTAPFITRRSAPSMQVG